MILKSKGRRNSTGVIGRVINYVARDSATLKNAKGQPVYLKWNVTGKTLEEVIKEFELNNSLRPYRSNGLACYHDMISWHEKSSRHLSVATITKIVNRYIELRGENGMYFAAIHNDKPTPHVHLAVSANEAFSPKAMRISKARLMEIKRELQDYEKRFPLSASFVDYHKPGKSKSDVEYQIERRTGQKSRKEEIKSLLETTYQVALSTEDFYKRIEDSGIGLKIYTRGEVSKGIDDEGRHMRFSSLGITAEHLEELQERGERLQELQVVRQEPVTQAEKEKIEEKENEETIEQNDMPELV